MPQRSISSIYKVRKIEEARSIAIFGNETNFVRVAVRLKEKLTFPNAQ